MPGTRPAPGVCVICNINDQFPPIGPEYTPPAPLQPAPDIAKPQRSPENEAQAQAEHDLYKMHCGGKPFHPDPCTQLEMEIQRTILCFEGMSRWDAKWGNGTRHALDIAIWKQRLKDLKERQDKECKKDNCEK